MKPTCKVNIGGYAYTMDEDAYQLFDDYFRALENHFKEEGKEIISDIELRVSELLRLRLSGKHQVVSGDDAAEIINIMGKPADISDNDSSEDDQGRINDTPFDKASSRKLFRDKESAVLGGVFSGLSHFLKFDLVALRMICMILFILACFVSAKISCALILLYMIMWIITPRAKTFYDKLLMTGTKPSIYDIENRESTLPAKYKGGIFRTLLKIIIYVVFGLITAISFAAIVTVIIGFIWISIGHQSVSMSDYLSVFGLNTFNFKASLLLVLLLPLVGILYLSLKVLMSSRFVLRDLFISVMAVLLLISAGAFIGIKAYNTFGIYDHSQTVSERIPVSISADTVNIKIDNRYLAARPIQPFAEDLYMLEEEGQKSLFQRPNVIVYQDSTINELKIEIKKTAMEETSYLAKRKAASISLPYVADSTSITLSPLLYNAGNRWYLETFTIIVNAPEGKTIIVDDMLSPFFRHQH